MEIELAEIRNFIAKQSPFDLLSKTELDNLPKACSIRYFRRGQAITETGSGETVFFLVRTGAIEIRDAQDQLVDKLAEGDSYSLQCTTTEKPPLNAVCVEDTLVYFLPCKKINYLREQFKSFNQYFTHSLNARMHYAVEQTHAAGMRDLSAMKLEVNGLTDRMPVVVDIATSIQDAAKLMTQEKVSAILVTDNNQLAGLLTDRDIRSRCVAEGISVNESVSRIMTQNLQTVTNKALLSEALLVMTRYQVQHLPILKNDIPTGILTTSDVVRHLSTSPALIATDIYKANSVDALVKISARIPELQLQLSLSSATAKHIGEVMSSVTDAITCRLLELAEQQLGEAPISYVWAAGGSQARNEQTSHSDQDNALLLSDDYRPEHKTYFKELAQFVSNGLDSCGYIFCPGNAMATNPQWCQSVSVWKKYFSNWINSPEPKALMLSSIFFDLRPVYGEVLLFKELQKEVLAQTKKNELFISHMVSNALTHKPPLGFFRSFVLSHDAEHKNMFDLKHRGIVPIVDIARVLALNEGIDECNTVERLEAAYQCKALSKEMQDNLLNAFEFISTLRVRHQAEQIKAGLPADNYLSPREISGLEKNHLKDSFSIIKVMQQFFESRNQSL